MKKHLLLMLFALLSIHTATWAQNLVQSFIEGNVTGTTHFGSSVSAAGDVNNDGYDDVIVGVPSFSMGIGRAYIFYGSNSMDNVADVIFSGETCYNSFGKSVSKAGDVNNDGYDDVIVGASGYSSITGRAYIFYGGAAMDNIADVTLTGETINNEFGCSVSSAGDVNKDGFSDVIVGARAYSNSTGRVYIYYGGNSMNNVADVILTGETTTMNYTNFGSSVSTAGDVNKDGFDDIIIGAYLHSMSTGMAYIYYGGSSMDNTADVPLTGKTTANYFGYSVSTAGDVNNDGYADVIVGAYGYSSNTGQAYIYYGNSMMDDIADVTLTGETTDSYFGGSVASAGDINNDGYDDVIVGTYRYDPFIGKAFIYLGGSPMDDVAELTLTRGISNCFGVSVSSAGDLNKDGYDDIIVGDYGYSSSYGQAYIYWGNNAINSTPDVTLTGEATNNLGCSVSSAGDVNNDGYDDIIVGASEYSSSTGRAYIYFGGSTVDNTPDVILTGESNNNLFGYSVSTAGDVNKDGYADVIVGALENSSYTGRAYIYFGGNTMDNIPEVILSGNAVTNLFGYSVSTAGDVNNDGYDDVIVGALQNSSSSGRASIYYGGNSMDNIADIILTGETYGTYYGGSVSTAGDVNNDGYDDVILGAFSFSSFTGRVYIFYGGNIMDNIADVILTGEGVSNMFGNFVSAAGDVNNDGYDDIIIGAHGYSSYTGRAYIYYGGSSMDNTADVIFTGEATNNYFGLPVASAGDINKDGYDDVIIGARRYSSDKGRAYIYYGGNAMDNIADVVFTGEATNDNFGSSVSKAGDVNGDGQDEIIIGASNYLAMGKAYIYGFYNPQTSSSDVIQLKTYQPQIALFPNPCRETLNISGLQVFAQGKSVTIQIFDNQGKMVASQERIMVTDLETINVNAFPSGNYSVIIQTKKTKKTLGLIKI